VTSFDAMVAALSALSDQAAAKFNQQTSTAATLAASMSDTITAMREAAALNEQMTEKYVQQTLMLDAATGQLNEDWSCNREKYWELHFATNRYAACTAFGTACSFYCLEVGMCRNAESKRLWLLACSSWGASL
jgi:hypothetical protein